MSVIWSFVWGFLALVAIIIIVSAVLGFLSETHERICDRFGELYGAAFSGVVIGLALSLVGVCIDYLA